MLGIDTYPRVQAIAKALEQVQLLQQFRHAGVALDTASLVSVSDTPGASPSLQPIPYEYRAHPHVRFRAPE